MKNNRITLIFKVKQPQKISQKFIKKFFNKK